MNIPTLEKTIVYIKKPEAADQNLIEQHLENLLYMKSILYLDDKKNEKHLNRIRQALDSIKKEYHKELSEVSKTEDAVSLAAQILFANKIVDSGIARLKGILEKKIPHESEPEAKMKPSASVEEDSRSGEMKINPKLKETLSFLVSSVEDPLRTSKNAASHFYNLEKMSKLIKRDYQDPKLQKVNEKILGVLGKIFDCHARKDINHALDNSILILKNLSTYQKSITSFEMDIKNYLSKAQAERAEDTAPFSREAHMEKFYAEFKDERNMVKKINLARKVLTSAAYKYDKELNAASLKLLKELEKMGLDVDVADLDSRGSY